MKNKNNLLNIIIILLVLIVGIIGVFVYQNYFSNGSNNEKSDIVFKLKGNEYITHNLGDPYIDSGFTLEGDNVDITSGFSSENNVNSNEEGNYTVIYKYNDLVLTRHVEVKKINSFKLLGEENIYLVTNGEYIDDKYEAIVNGKDVSDTVTINSNLDSTKNGKYTITYTCASLNKTLTRNIYVSDFSAYFKINYDSTTQYTRITLNIEMDADKVSKYVLPDNTEKTTNDTYTVSDNKSYDFYVCDKYNNCLQRRITINNIEPEKENFKATCTAKASYNKTEIKVSSNRTIVKYVYNGIASTNNTYTFNTMVKTNKVVVYDEDNEHLEITCQTEIDNSSKLEIHFIASGYYDDAILIRSNNATIFIDGGRGKDRVLDYLKKLNVSTIDYVIGSHTEYDHIDAQGAVIRTFNVKNVIYPNNIYSCGCACETNDVRSVLSGLSARGLKARVQGVPSKLQIGDMTLYFIAPFSIGCNKNNNSFIFILQFGNNKFMFTGDADSALNDINKLQANAKAAGLPNIKANVFKYPHHGNQYLSTKLIQTISPQFLVVPNYNARNYGGPVAGVPAYRQSDSSTGNILVTSDGNEVKVVMNVSPTTYAR